MRRLGLFIIIFSIVASLAVPQIVAATSSPALDNAKPHTGSKDECLAQSAGKDVYCVNGKWYNDIVSLYKLVGGGKTFAEFENGVAALRDGRETLQGSRLRSTDSDVFGIIFNLNYDLLDQRPASGIVFALDRLESIGSPESVYAADPQPYFPGTGFELMQPIQAFWGWGVAVSYSFMILIIIAVAFALMFRAKLDGQQVVQLQNAIPSIVLAMILIPLSYPISGLFIDAISLGTNAVHGFVFGQGGPGRTVYEEGHAGESFNNEGGRGLYADDYRVNVFRVRELIGIQSVGNGLGNIVCPDTGATGNCINSTEYGVLNFIDQIIKAVVPESDGQSGVSFIIGEVLNFLFTLMAIVVSFRIAWRLIKKLLVLMFMPILSPFIFATIAIPGTGMKNLMGYLKGLGAASLHYIVAYALFLFAIIFTNEAFFRTIPNVETYRYTPPLLGVIGQAVTSVGNDTVNITGSSTAMLFTLLGAGLFLSIPKILDGINEKLGVEEGFIPKALKPYVDDMRYSGDVAFRKAPATIRSTGGSALSLATTPFKVGGKWFGDRKDSRFDKSTGEQYVRDSQKRLAEMETAMEQEQNPIRKRIMQANLARERGIRSARASLYGQGGKLSPKQGEGGVSYDVTVSFPQLEGGVNTGTFKKMISVGAPIPGVITIKSGDKDTPPRGSIVFKAQDGGAKGEIGVLSFNRTSTVASIRLAVANQKDPDGKVYLITDKNVSFQGGDRAFIDIVAEFPPSAYAPGAWSLDFLPDGKVIEVGVGDGPNKKGFFTFRVA